MNSPLALTLLGLVIIGATVGVLLRGKTHPVVAMTLIPFAGALLAGSGLAEISEYYGAGLDRVINVVVMFIFAIIYFGILADVGLFEPVITALIRATRGKIVLVTVGTAAIAVVAHLDGSGSTTFLLTIPALLPLYQALGMSRYVLLTIVALSASVMNMVPWAGPVGRAATVIDSTPNEIWQHLLPAQAIALVSVLIVSAILGVTERRRLAKTGVGSTTVDVHAIADDFASAQRKERASLNLTPRAGTWTVWANAAITIALIGVLVSGVVTPAPAFLVGTAILLVINFPSLDAQSDILRRHAPTALSMAGVILAAAMFLGVLDGTGMLEQIALSLISILPAAVGPYVHIIIGLLGVPLDLATSTDAYYFSLLPIVQSTAEAFGVSGMGAAAAMIIGNVIGTFVSPFSPALWLAIGLAGANMGKYIRFAFPIAWVFSGVLVLASWAMGLLV
ncbi:CitMHS family transporter [Corynebacterium timonense]|uniref:Citrate-Mg2+:H+ or citrate-Ca2+:H+ symporter, CitMHS family n=1 Tax=Corynebacterium timonense TaxID=441500 RepID=A0A1H1QA24_9CORY|nr:citrate:proton symporter [Corynebacterium timonense]SDS20371.1 citrate-Mg2+:H+ or citrate-Ca2+:H+ symporter, CitMHS family [Corynebacterium timonense]